jgi:MFS family permease
LEVRIKSIIGIVGIGTWNPPKYFLIYYYVDCRFSSGIGLGMIYLPAIVSVTCYFEERRAFATGIAVCGSGFGTFVLVSFNVFLRGHKT